MLNQIGNKNTFCSLCFLYRKDTDKPQKIKNAFLILETHFKFIVLRFYLAMLY